MSYIEYEGMFWEAQAKGANDSQYRMLALDTAGSRQFEGGYGIDVLDALAMEAARLLAEGRVLMPFRYQSVVDNARVAVDPTLTFIVKGDFRGLLISELALRDLLGLDRSRPTGDVQAEVDAYLEEVLIQAAELAGIDFDIHWASGVFETWEWAEAGKKHALAYCAPQLEEISKSNGKMLYRVA